MSESTVQNQIRVAAARKGWLLWRNNTGVAFDVNGRPIRYGLANDSKKLNAQIKSADLIGVRPVTITPDMVGQTIGQFVAIEVKQENWKKPTGLREKAQERFLRLVNGVGAYGLFAARVPPELTDQ